MEHSQDVTRTSKTESRAVANHVSKGAGSPAGIAMRKAKPAPDPAAAQPLLSEEREGEGTAVVQGKFKITKGLPYDKANAGTIAGNATLTKKLTEENGSSIKDKLKAMAEEDRDYGELTWNEAIALAEKKIGKAIDEQAVVADTLAVTKKVPVKDLHERKKGAEAENKSKAAVERKMKVTGASLSFDKCLEALNAGKLPGEMTWDDIEVNIKKGIGEVKDFGDTMRKVISIVYKTGINKDSRYKFGYSAQDKADIQKAYSADIVETLEPRKYSSADDKIMQQLRWISTTVLNSLNSGKKKVADEVQTLWDGKQLYITENLLSNNKDIEALLKSGSNLEKFLKKYEGKSKDEDRFERHPAELSAAMQDAKKKKGADSPVSTLLEGNVSVSKPTEDLGDNMHAETRLVLNYISALQDEEEVKKGKVYVAGVMRPCFACYVRLEVQKEKLEAYDKTLVSNPHHGFPWVSANSWKDTSTEDKLKALEKIGLFEYIRSLGADDKTIMTEFIKDEHIHLTASSDKGYDRDTDSEADD